MILIDTSAWIEYLRDVNHPLKVTPAIESLLHRLSIRMEVLAGARDEHHMVQLRRVLARGTNLQTMSVDYDHAALLYRQCRVNGETVRKIIYCLIAAVAIRNDVKVLHQDGDFDVLARHTELRTV